MTKNNTLEGKSNQLNLEQLANTFPYIVPEDKKNILSQFESLKPKEESQINAFKIIHKLIILLTKSKDISASLKSINFVVQKLTKEDPYFLIFLIEISVNTNFGDTNLLELVSSLDCLTDDSLPDIHIFIQMHISLKALLYYLSKHITQLNSLITSNVLIRLIIRSHLEDLDDISYLFELLVLLPPHFSKNVCDIIKKSLPEDFPWSKEHKAALLEIDRYINIFVKIKIQYNSDLDELLKTISHIDSFKAIRSKDLLVIFSEIICLCDRTNLNEYLSTIFSQIPLSHSIEVFLLLFNALNKLMENWKYQCQHLYERNIYTVTDFFIKSALAQLILMKKDIRFDGEKFLIYQDNTLSKLLNGIVFCTPEHIKQVFNELLSHQDKCFDGKQYQMMTLINKLVNVYFEMVKKKEYNIIKIDKVFFETLDSIKNRIDTCFQKPIFKIYEFKCSELYKTIKSKIYFEELIELIPDFEQQLFMNLHRPTPVYLDPFINKIQNELLKKNVLQFIVDVCNQLFLNKEIKMLITDIREHYITKLEHISYQNGLEIIIDEPTMRPVLMAYELSEEILNDFYSALSHCQFTSNKPLISKLKNLAGCKNILILTYFISCLEYSRSAYNPERKEEVKMLKVLLDTFKQGLKEFLQSKELKAKCVEKESELCIIEKKEDDHVHSKISQNNKKGKKTNHKPKVVDQSLELKPLLNMDDFVIQLRTYAKTKRKIALYQLYSNLLIELMHQFNHIKSFGHENAKALKLDEQQFNRVNTYLIQFLSKILDQKSKVLLHLKEHDKVKVDFEFKAETMIIKKKISQNICSNIKDCFKTHNQMISALLLELHANDKQYNTGDESDLLAHINELLLFSYTGISDKQCATLIWLRELGEKVEKEALKNPSFENCQPGFFRAGIYGSFIAHMFENEAYSDESSSPTQYDGDIDCAFYIDTKCSQHKNLSINQMEILQQLMHMYLSIEAQERFKIVQGGIATWHGFSYHGQKCDITFKESLPIPVVSHCCLFYGLNDNQVSFLSNGEHALLHIRTNRLNIIAPQEQHLQPCIMAHILKKVFMYMEKGVKLTQKSKIILGHLFNNEYVANLTITRFILTYSRTNLNYYSQIFSNFHFEVIIDNKINKFTLAEYIIKQAIRLDERINPDFAMKCIPLIDFKSFFHQEIRDFMFMGAILKFCHTEIRRLEYQSLIQNSARERGFFSIKIPTTSMSETSEDLRFLGYVRKML